MQLKDRLVVKIEKIAFGGEGVGRIDKFVVFVPFAAPEDELEIEITQCKKKFARGRILKIIKASPLRVKPLCRYYEKCGGCCYQHISYEEQLKIKKQQVEDIFLKIAKITVPPVMPLVASPRSYHYRGKAQCHLRISSAGSKLGFLDISGGKIVDIERCEIMEETINKKISRLRESAFIPYKEDARLSIWSDLSNELPDKKGQIKRVVKGKEFLVPSGGFFQNNLFLTEALVDAVCQMALSGKLDMLVDVYCGCGLFSIFLAPFAREVFGIELNPKAVKFAQINATKENIKNVTFICGDAGEELLKRQYLPLSGEIDLLILDPPRTGCGGSVLQTITGLQPRRLIYISCNPATQARDVRILGESGYKLLRLFPLDMFPQTQHVEVLALLEH
ncbi:MAG: class I SAM-dependent RNA methyltransferase [Smithellaceae bacterium]